MRPAISFTNALLTHAASVDLALIAWGTFRYNRQELPVTRFQNPSRFEHLSAQEAAMGSQPPQSDDHDFTEEPTSAQCDSSRTPETRSERLVRIRAEIQAGTYDTEAKMEAAIDRMLGRIF